MLSSIISYSGSSEDIVEFDNQALDFKASGRQHGRYTPQNLRPKLSLRTPLRALPIGFSHEEWLKMA